MPSIRRLPVKGQLVPAEVTQPVVEKLLNGHENPGKAAQALSQVWPEVEAGSWKQTLYRILRGDKVTPATYERLCLAAGLEPRGPDFKQTMFRVTGFSPWASEAVDDRVRHWYYLRKTDATRRARSLKQQGLLVEMHMGEVLWQETDLL